uniref:Uncharacterized protein n=1 Tax=Oryza nivara TaxID=4536 RepID=A0A0E0J2S3_ORYNI
MAASLMALRSADVEVVVELEGPQRVPGDTTGRPTGYSELVCMVERAGLRLQMPSFAWWDDTAAAPFDLFDVKTTAPSPSFVSSPSRHRRRITGRRRGAALHLSRLAPSTPAPPASPVPLRRRPCRSRLATACRLPGPIFGRRGNPSGYRRASVLRPPPSRHRPPPLPSCPADRPTDTKRERRNRGREEGREMTQPDMWGPRGSHADPAAT